MRARLALAILAAAAPALKAQATVDGWRYTTTMTSDSGDGHPRVITMRHVIADGLLRTEFTSNDLRRPESAFGTYTIQNVRDSSFYTVMPAQQMATLIANPNVRAAAVVLPKYVAHETSSTHTDLGSGEKLMGHETHRYRTTTKGTVETTYEGRTCTQNVDAENEVWIAADVDPSAMFAAEWRILGTRPPSADSSRARSDTAKGPRGFALRTRSTRAGVDSAGHPRNIVTTVEYTELEHGPIDRSLFEVPAGYRIMDLRRFANANPAGANDVIRRITSNTLCQSGK